MSIRTFVAGLGIVAGFLGSSALAGTIATVSTDRLLYETAAGKRASAAFDKTRTEKQAELDKRQKDLQKQAAELDKQSATLKPDLLASKKAVLERQFQDLQQVYVKLERELAQDRTKLVQDLMKQAAPIIADLAKKGGIDVVVDSATVVWSLPGADITDKVVPQMK